MNKKDNKGFTLVELIVVLVILAILAAILVPALLGYIDDAKKKQYILDARNLFTATQSELSKIYAIRDDYKVSRETDKKCVNIVENGRGENLAICMVNDYSISRDIFKLAGYDMYDPNPGSKWYEKANKWKLLNTTDNDVSFFCIGMGNYDYYCDPKKTATYDPHKAYTAYFIIYQPYEGGDFIFYDGESYQDKWPLNLKFDDTFKSGNKEKYKYTINGEEIVIQFYMFKIGEGAQEKRNQDKMRSYAKLVDQKYSN